MIKDGHKSSSLVLVLGLNAVVDLHCSLDGTHAQRLVVVLAVCRLGRQQRRIVVGGAIGQHVSTHPKLIVGNATLGVAACPLYANGLAVVLEQQSRAIPMVVRGLGIEQV